MEDFNEKGDQLERVREEMARAPQHRDVWRKLFEDANWRQEEKTARLKREYKERSECLKQLNLDKLERVVFSRNQSVEFLTPRDYSNAGDVRFWKTDDPRSKRYPGRSRSGEDHAETS